MSTRLILLLASLLFAGQAAATGVGFSYGLGSESWDYDEPFGAASEDRDVETLSFVLDTAVSSSRLFNYRFTIGTETSTVRGMEFQGRSMTHSFGFRVVDIPVLRLWIGPEIRIAGYEDFEDRSTGSRHGGFILGLGIGPVVGLNFHLPEVVSFGLSFAYQRMSYSGHHGGTDYEAESFGGYVQASMLFRFNEGF